MAIEATYRGGAFYPSQPVSLPENTRVAVTLPKESFKADCEELVAARPKAPKITPEEFDAIIRSNPLSAPSLPIDFSREDIYSDHD